MDVVGHSEADGSADVIRYYDLWRQIANVGNKYTYDEADWDDGRLYFRSDYGDKVKEWRKWIQYGDWAAWIIERTPQNYYSVVRSLKHERAYHRTENVEAVFSKIADAGKYVILQIGDYLRLDFRLETLFIKWDAIGLDSRIKVTPAPRDAIEYIIRVSPRTPKEFVEQRLKQYTMRENSSCYGFALPESQTNMQVLALTYEELNSALIDGMPVSVTSQVVNWADQLGIHITEP